MNLEGLQVLVMGLGRSGLSAVQLLLERGAFVAATDMKSAAGLGEAAKQLEDWGVPILPQATAVVDKYPLIVLSPGVPADLPMLQAARRAGSQVVGEVELAGWYLKGPAIGITGANGKTTTTALTGHILSECGVSSQVGGNIGLPPTAMVASSQPERWNVLELSSFQLETMETFRVHTAAILNLTPDHLDRHHTMELYAAAKGRILENQLPDDTVILNADDPWCVAYAAQSKGKVIWFSTRRSVTHGLWLEAGNILLDGTTLMPAADVPVRGLHNLANTMAAAAAALSAGAKPEAIAEAVRTFPGVEHRLEQVARIDEVDYVNDSKATNVDATLKALESFSGNLWVILGGRDKGTDYTPLRALLGSKARAVLLIGESAVKLRDQLAGAVSLEDCGTLAQAVAYARTHALPGDTVLLAPAAASFDQFDNFEHRGRVFKQIVRALQTEVAE